MITLRSQCVTSVLGHDQALHEDEQRRLLVLDVPAPQRLADKIFQLEHLEVKFSLELHLKELVESALGVLGGDDYHAAWLPESYPAY